MLYQEVFLYFGLIASIWIVFGVLFVASRYGGYSHARQFCSELGATGSPTEKLSPLINNYPLGILFCLFGWSVTELTNATLLIQLSGWMIVCHGIGTWIAGYFPMDADAYTAEPSFSSKVHGSAGLVMTLSLLVAPLLVVFSGEFEAIRLGFKLFSVAGLLATIYFTYTLAKAYESKSNPGLQQRLSYGAQLLWLAGYSIVLAH